MRAEPTRRLSIAASFVVGAAAACAPAPASPRVDAVPLPTADPVATATANASTPPAPAALPSDEPVALGAVECDCDVAIDDSSVYFADGRELQRMARAGGARTQLARLPSGVPVSVALYGATLFVRIEDYRRRIIASAPASGGALTVLAGEPLKSDELRTGFAARGGRVFWLRELEGNGGVDGEVVGMSADGGAVKLLSPRGNGQLSFAADDDGLYTESLEEIRRVPLDGGAWSRLANTFPARLEVLFLGPCIAVSGDSVYVVATKNGFVDGGYADPGFVAVRYAKSSGQHEVLAVLPGQGTDRPRALAAGDGVVYVAMSHGDSGYLVALPDGGAMRTVVDRRPIARVFPAGSEVFWIEKVVHGGPDKPTGMSCTLWKTSPPR